MLGTIFLIKHLVEDAQKRFLGKALRIMKISIKVKVHARENKVEKVDSENLIVHVKEVPEKGKANWAIIKLIAEYYDVPTTHVRIVTGRTSSKKLLEIQGR